MPTSQGQGAGSQQRAGDYPQGGAQGLDRGTVVSLHSSTEREVDPAARGAAGGAAERRLICATRWFFFYEENIRVEMQQEA